jgi:ubiquinone/menaquinone biosynthesis C-methylase UbiE
MGVALNVADRKDVAAAVDALTVRPDAAVADVGFGGGVGIVLLLDRIDDRGHVHGVEVSSMMLRVAARRFHDEISAGRLELHRASMTNLPCATASLDGIVTTHTVYFVSELEPAFGEFARALKGTGQVVVGLGDPVVMRSFADYGFRVRPMPEVVYGLERSGLTVTEHRHIGTGSGQFHLIRATPRERTERESP